MNADTIVALLRQRHHRDIFVGECKDGPSSCVSSSRMDAWAMKRSWANPCMWGYEVKVNRRDFVGDDKWPNYLPLCNQLYFVAPPRLIKTEELPSGVGLLEVAKTGSLLRTIRKASHREIEAPIALYQYLLMCRCKITPDWTEAEDPQRKADFWLAWLANKKRNLEVGHEVSRTLSRMIEEKILAVESRNEKLESENKGLDDVKALLDSMDIEVHRWNLTQKVEEQIKRVRQLVPQDVLDTLRRAKNDLDSLLINFGETRPQRDKRERTEYE